MSDLLSALAWLLLAVLSMRALALLLLFPDARAVRRGGSGVRHVARPAPAPVTRAAPQRASDVPIAAATTAAPAVPDERSGVVLLGRDEAELEMAGSAARRHLPLFAQERAVVAAPLDPPDRLRPVSVSAARVAVLGSPRPGDTDAALRACTAAGRPLLLPASS